MTRSWNANSYLPLLPIRRWSSNHRLAKDSLRRFLVTIWPPLKPPNTQIYLKKNHHMLHNSRNLELILHISLGHYSSWIIGFFVLKWLLRRSLLSYHYCTNHNLKNSNKNPVMLQELNWTRLQEGSSWSWRSS